MISFRRLRGIADAVSLGVGDGALLTVLMLGGYNISGSLRICTMLPALIQGLLNMIFFFYLVRTEVREKLQDVSGTARLNGTCRW